jgi:hypothetical protein
MRIFLGACARGRLLDSLQSVVFLLYFSAQSGKKAPLPEFQLHASYSFQQIRSLVLCGKRVQIREHD